MSDAGAPTINDVASAAGVSVRTASRVLNQSPKVNAQTRARVQEVIRELNYIPNLRARALASNRSFMLGFVHDDPNAEIADQVQRGIFRECTKHGYEMIVHHCDHKSPQLVENVLAFVRRSRVDGIILIAPLSDNPELARGLREQHVPVAAVASAPLDPYHYMLVSREGEASAEIAEHFVALGHRDIAMITGPLVQRASRERFDGFTGALARVGIRIRPEHICEGDWSFESGLECARRLLQSDGVRPTAIYGGNDRMAAAVLKVAAQSGIRVPEDLSVVGFDDSYLARVVTPALTTITRPLTRIGERAAQWLLAGKDEDPEWALGPRYFDLALTLRESTAPAPMPR